MARRRKVRTWRIIPSSGIRFSGVNKMPFIRALPITPPSPPPGDSHWTGNTITASSNSVADVSSAISSASNGDIVEIPNGSVTWSSGITTSKQILIRAATINPTNGGRSTQSLVITNNSSAALFAFTTGNSYHVGLAGIRFNEGTGSGEHITVTGSGSKVPILYDIYYEQEDRGFPGGKAMEFSCRGGIMWRCYANGVFNVEIAGEGSPRIKYGSEIRAWTTASTMGSADDGTWNFYVEECTFKNVGNCFDVDDCGRFVVRYSTYDGSWGETHGYSSLLGGRHWEFYNNTFQSTTSRRNLAGRYWWCRAGTGVFTDNVVNDATDTETYGSVRQLDIGDTSTPGTYLQDRQPGCGHNGSAYVSDPIYIWNQTGAQAYTYGFQNGWDSIVQVNRDLYVNNGAKPGYTKFTYPHPLVSGCPTS